MYTVRNYVGSTYVVPSTDNENEEDPRAILAALRKAADALDGADYADSPKQAQERTELTRALYLLQADAIASRDERGSQVKIESNRGMNRGDVFLVPVELPIERHCP